MSRLPKSVHIAVLVALSSIPGERTSAQVLANDNRQPSLPAARAWRVAAEPIFVTGHGRGGDTVPLFRIRGVVSFPDGRVVVGNAGGNELVYLDRDGSLSLRAGRQGQGPGEFVDVSAIGRAEDWVWAMDHHRGILSVFDEMGTLRRTIPLRQLVPVSGMVPRGTLADGRLVLTSSTALLGARLPHPDSTDILLLDLSTNEARKIGRIPKSDLGNPVGTRIFGAPTVTVAGGDRIYWGSGSTFEIFVLAMDGSLRTRFVKPAAPRPLTPDMWRRYVDRRLALIGSSSPDGSSRRRDLRSQLEELERPRTLPAFDELLVDHSGNLWVHEYAIRGVVSGRWHVFDSDGRWLTPVDVPDAFDLHEVNPFGLLGVLRDDEGVERVALLRLVKP